MVVDVDHRRAAREEIGVLAAEAALVAAVEREQRPALRAWPGRHWRSSPLVSRNATSCGMLDSGSRYVRTCLPSCRSAAAAADHRADRIAVGVLVGGDEDAVGRSKSGDHGLQVGIECDVGHSGLGLDRR